MKGEDVCVHGACNLRVVLVVLGGFLVHLAIGGSYVLGNFGPYFVSYIRNRTDDTSVKNIDTLWVTSLGAVGGMLGMSIGGLLAHRFGPKVAILIGTVIFRFYFLGNFGPYFISYLRDRTDDNSVKNVDTLWVSSLGGVGNMIGMSIGGLLAYRFGPKVAILTGSVIFSTSVAMGYFTVGVSYMMVVFSYGFATHLGSAITYGTSIQTAIKWLPKHSTLAAGLIASGTGLSSVVFNPVVTFFINPDNLLPDYTDSDDEKYFTQEDLLDRVPMCFVILGSSYFALQLIGVLCIADPPRPNLEVRITQEQGESQTLLPKYTYKPDRGSTPGSNWGSTRGSTRGDTRITSGTLGSHVSTYSYRSEFDDISDSFTTDTDYTETESLIKTATTDIDRVTYNNAAVASQRVKPSSAYRSSDMVPHKHIAADVTDEELSICGAIKFALMSRSFYIIWLTCFLLPAGMQFFVGLYKAYGQTFIYDDHFLTLVGTVAAVFNCAGRPIWGIMMDVAGFKVTLACISFGFAVITGTIFLTEQVAREWFLVWICSIYLFYSGIWAMMPSALAKLLGAKNMAINYGLITSGSCLATLLGGTLASTLKTEIGWHGLWFLSSGMAGIVFISSLFFNGVAQDGTKI